MTRQILTGARIFDGTAFIDGMALVIEDAHITALIPADEAPEKAQRITGTIVPGFIDLQINGGGGLQVDENTDQAALRRICAAHIALGTVGCLPTLISDTAETTAGIITHGMDAARQQLPGFLGLHLEGPHIAPRKKGAHDPALIRAMTADDLNRLCDAAQALPHLMVTLAPESVSAEQIAALTQAGAVVSLGHTDCSFETAMAAFRAGARCATHLFNAMSQITSRAPGLAGAVLGGHSQAGLIADGIHVHPAVMRMALAARPEGIFLVSDCMAFAGTGLTEMRLNGRQVLRRDGRLTLADGTLAGADLTMADAIQVLIDDVGITPERALRMASTEPARLLGLQDRYGKIAPGRMADLVLLDTDGRLKATCIGGQWV